MEKTVCFHIFLFGKPEWEFEKEISPETIKSKGDELKERLHEVAEDLQKLRNNGWHYELCLYDIMLTKSTSMAAAKKELSELGINEELDEFEDEE